LRRKSRWRLQNLVFSGPVTVLGPLQKEVLVGLHLKVEIAKIEKEKD
jgi:hypothetical protein